MWRCMEHLRLPPIAQKHKSPSDLYGIPAFTWHQHWAWLWDAHILRNAGGRVTDDMIRLLAASATDGNPRNVVLHHTDCGAQNLWERSFPWQHLKKELGVDVECTSSPFKTLKRSPRRYGDFESFPYSRGWWFLRSCMMWIQVWLPK